jgi:hypothetical protein
LFQGPRLLRTDKHEDTTNISGTRTYVVTVVLAGSVIVVRLPEIDVVTVEAGRVDVVVKNSVETGGLALYYT